MRRRRRRQEEGQVITRDSDWLVEGSTSPSSRICSKSKRSDEREGRAETLSHLPT
jgi:hypothetical protein